MRRKILFLLLTGFVLTASASAADQSPSRIIDRYRKASGGGALKRVRSTLMTGAIKTSDGASGRFTYRSSVPDRLRIDMDVAGAKVSECYNGKSAWRLDASGLRTLLGDEAKRLRLEALLAAGRLRDLGRAKIVPATGETTTVDGRRVEALEFAKDGVRIKLFFDSATHLLVKQERDTSAGLEEMSFSDHRPVDGVMEPFAIRIHRDKQQLSIVLDRVVHNGEIEAAAFRYPQVEGSRPLPELEPLMKSITENQETIDEMRERYTCRLTETMLKLDGDGRVKETEVKIYEVTPVAGSFVERLISVNGKELSSSEQEKEDKRVQKEVEELIKDKEKRDRKKERAREKGEKEDDDDVTISDFLRISEITSVRREMFRSHEVVAFDFEPRKGYKPKNRVENLINKLAGTLWVDEEARQIARLEAHLTDSFKVGGGLFASIGSSTAFAFEQEKVDGEVWLPSYGEANISARILLLAKFNRSMLRQYTDYRKYQIESDYKLAKPGQPKPEKQ